MTKEFDKIYLAWRKGAGSRRHIVGLLEKKSDGRNIFKYEPEVEDLRSKEGFIPYTEFQDIHKEYNGTVAEIFGQRLTKIGRQDASAFLKFWEVDLDKADDKFYLLGKTQGLVATDNFEFLAEYLLIPDTHFLTDLAGLSHQKLDREFLIPGDQLRFELETENPQDPDAVKIFKDDIHIGYIKKIHNRIFKQPGADKLKLTVKALDQNGIIIKQAFVKVSTH